jgi:hypothetical protein
MRVLPNRFARQSGIAIGPILFIVAILAILATAIAAGSSTFATSSGQEAARTNAAALIQIGQNLKLGADRLITMGTPPRIRPISSHPRAVVLWRRPPRLRIRLQRISGFIPMPMSLTLAPAA